MAESELPKLITRVVCAVLADRPSPDWLANVLKERKALVEELNRCLTPSLTNCEQQTNGGESCPTDSGLGS